MNGWHRNNRSGLGKRCTTEGASRGTLPGIGSRHYSLATKGGERSRSCAPLGVAHAGGRQAPSHARRPDRLAQSCPVQCLVNHQIATAKRVGSRFSVLCIDLDGFKPVSDIHGHAASNATLCEVAGRLRSKLRGSDMAVRLGGDKFAVILLGPLGSSVGRIADILIRALSKPYVFSGEALRISASIGVAGCPEACTDVGEPGVELLKTYKPHWSKKGK